MTTSTQTTTTPRTTPLAALVGLLLLAAPSPSHAGTTRASVEGSLDKDAVREVVRAHIDEVRSCYNAELSEDGNVAGDIVVAFVIAGDGQVGNVTIASSSMPARFDACLATAVEQWTFPAAGGETTVSYPFKMTAE